MSNDINIAFCRALLSTLRGELTPEQKQRLKGCWVYKVGRDQWEFQLTSEGFYWSDSADNAYDARYKGINAWLRKNYPESQS